MLTACDDNIVFFFDHGGSRHWWFSLIFSVQSGLLYSNQWYDSRRLHSERH